LFPEKKMPFAKIRDYSSAEDLKMRETRAGLTTLCCRLGPLIAVPNNGIPFWKLFDLANDQNPPISSVNTNNINCINNNQDLPIVSNTVVPTILGHSASLSSSAKTKNSRSKMKNRTTATSSSLSDSGDHHHHHLSLNQNLNDSVRLSEVLVAGDPGFDQLDLYHDSNNNAESQSASLVAPKRKKRKKTDDISTTAPQSRGKGTGVRWNTEHSVEWFTNSGHTGGNNRDLDNLLSSDDSNKHPDPVLIPLNGSAELVDGIPWTAKVDHIPESLLSSIAPSSSLSKKRDSKRSRELSLEVSDTQIDLSLSPLNQLLVQTGVLCNAVLMKHYVPNSRPYRFSVVTTTGVAEFVIKPSILPLNDEHQANSKEGHEDQDATIVDNDNQQVNNNNNNKSQSDIPTSTFMLIKCLLTYRMKIIKSLRRMASGQTTGADLDNDQDENEDDS
jgi:hypothetical protein